MLGGNKDAHHCSVAHHNLAWHLYFPSKIGIVWEVGGDGEARVISIADVAGYESIRCLSLHIAVAAQHHFTFFCRIFKPSDVEITWF